MKKPAPDHAEKANLSILAHPSARAIVLRVVSGDMNLDITLLPEEAQDVGVFLCKAADEMRALAAAK